MAKFRYHCWFHFPPYLPTTNPHRVLLTLGLTHTPNTFTSLHFTLSIPFLSFLLGHHSNLNGLCFHFCPPQSIQPSFTSMVVDVDCGMELGWVTGIFWQRRPCIFANLQFLKETQPTQNSSALPSHQDLSDCFPSTSHFWLSGFLSFLVLALFLPRLLMA